MRTILAMVVLGFLKPRSGAIRKLKRLGISQTDIGSVLERVGDDRCLFKVSQLLTEGRRYLRKECHSRGADCQTDFGLASGQRLLAFIESVSALMECGDVQVAHFANELGAWNYYLQGNQDSGERDIDSVAAEQETKQFLGWFSFARSWKDVSYVGSGGGAIDESEYNKYYVFVEFYASQPRRGRPKV